MRNYLKNATFVFIFIFIFTSCSPKALLSAARKISSETTTPLLKVFNGYPSGWESYTSANEVTDLNFDKDGNLWVASRGGVTYWDVNLKIYERFTIAEGLPNNFVTTILPASDDTVWIGTNYGEIARYSDEQWITYTISELKPTMSVTDILQDKNGDIWFTTLGAGAIRYDGETWKVFLLGDGLSSIAINGVTEDNTGRLWFETYVPCCMSVDFQNVKFNETGNVVTSGISFFKDGKWTVLYEELGLDDCCGPNHLTFSKDDLWIVPCGLNYMCRYDGNNLEKLPLDETVGLDYSIKAIASDSSLWFYSIFNGVIKYDGENWRRFSEVDGLLDNSISSAVISADGRIWFGTEKGVSVFDRENWGSYIVTDILSSLPTVEIKDLAIAPDNTIWLATSSGIVHFDGKSWQLFDETNSFPNYDYVFTIDVTDANTVWAGISYIDETNAYQGVVSFDGQSWNDNNTGILAPFDLVANPDGSIYALSTEEHILSSGIWRTRSLDEILAPDQILVTTDGKEWIRDSYYGKIYYYNDGHWVESYSDHTTAMSISPDGSLWIGEDILENPLEIGYNNQESSGITFSKFDGTKWVKQYALEDNVSLRRDSMVFSSDGSLWIAAYEIVSGIVIYHFEEGVWETFQANDYLAGGRVYGIFPSSDGSIWFITEGGITKYNP